MISRFLRRVFLILVVTALLFLIGVQVASYFFLKPILEREGRRIFQTPIYVDQAGANLFGGDFWMKGVRIKNAQGFQEPDFLSARTIAVDLSLLSFLTNEFAVRRILLKDPHFTFEVNEKGELNASLFVDRALDRFQKVAEKKPRLVHLITGYTLEKFAVRNGTVRFINQGETERNWTLRSISFSLARIVYPPDPEEALPAAVYVNATASGAQEGKVLVLGRFNPFVAKKSFDVTGSALGLSLSTYGDWMGDFPLKFADGTFQFKVKALCHENQIDIYEQIRIDKLKFQAKESEPKKPKLAFGLEPQTLLHFFNDLQPAGEPFEFDFRVTGDLGDPKFDVWQTIREKVGQIVYERVTNKIKSIEEKAKEVLPEGIVEANKVVSSQGS